MTHGIAEGVENLEGRAPWEPQADPQTEGRRRRAGAPPVDMGEAEVTVIPTLHYSAAIRNWHLTLECHFPGNGAHMSEGFALAAAACDAVGCILRGEPDEDWEENPESVEEAAAALVNAVRETLAESEQRPHE